MATEDLSATTAVTSTDSFDEAVALSPVAEPFSAFYDRQYQPLVGLAYVMTGNWSESEDLTQDAMIEAHRRWNQVSGYENPEAWIRRVLVNKHRSKLRRLSVETRTLIGLAHEGRSHESAPELDQVFSLVRQLPDRQAKAVALRYWDDLSVGQIAEVLDCGPETVKTHLRRGRARLQDLLAAESHPMAIRTAEDLAALRRDGTVSDLDQAAAAAHRRNDHETAAKSPKRGRRVAAALALLIGALGVTQLVDRDDSTSTEVTDAPDGIEDGGDRADDGADDRADERGLVGENPPGELVVRSESGAALVPLNGGGSVWNATGDRLLLYEQGGGHRVVDRVTGLPAGDVSLDPDDLDPIDIEYVYWHPTRPDTLISVRTDGLALFDVVDGRVSQRIAVAGCDELLAPDTQQLISPAGLMSYKCRSGDEIRLGLIDLATGEVESSTAGSDPTAAPVVSPSGERFAVADVEADVVTIYDTDWTPLFDFTWDQPATVTSVGGRDYVVGARYIGEATATLAAVDMTTADEWVVVGPTTGDDSPNPGIKLTASDNGLVAVGVGRANDPESTSRYEGALTAGSLNIIDLEAVDFTSPTHSSAAVEPMVLAPLGVEPDAAADDYWASWHISLDRSATAIALGFTEDGGAPATKVMPLDR